MLAKMKTEIFVNHEAYKASFHFAILFCSIQLRISGQMSLTIVSQIRSANIVIAIEMKIQKLPLFLRR